MNRAFNLSSFFFLIILCVSCSGKITSEELIEKAIDAHGGMEAWRSIDEITYSKRIVLYDSLGTIESDQTKTHTYKFKPTLTATMTWRQDSAHYQVNYSEEKTSVFLNDSLVQDVALLQKFEKEVEGAYYVYWMPYRLTEKNAELDYQGIAQLPSDGKVHKLQVSYPDSWNVWLYYFDIETFKLIATEVYHEPTSSFIKNLKYETKTGLSLNAERQSYRIDEAGEIMFKRADYYYTIENVMK